MSIKWKDFILDDEIGPFLAVDAREDEKCREKKRFGSPGVMDDAIGKKIQETGQEQQPARMVGYSSLFSNTSPGMDASRNSQIDSRLRGEA